MFRWYKKAAACYVYLSDLAPSPDKTATVHSLPNARWFTRGWTLQELIAPKDVRFYASDWEFIGAKEDMCGPFSSITGIDPHILAGGDIDTVSVAKRMSWASRRKTSRSEDAAYCLLGIFDVNIPLIYGEGSNAFRRLQEAIMFKTHDQSLFAWGKLVENPSELISKEAQFGLAPVPWKPPGERLPLLGLFADSPEYFESSGGISPADHPFSHDVGRLIPPRLLSGGVQIRLVILKTFLSVSYCDRPAIAWPSDVKIAVLPCTIGLAGGKLVDLVIRQWGDEHHGRTPELVVLNLSVSSTRFEPLL